MSYRRETITKGEYSVQKNTPYYYKTWFVVFMLFLFFLAGLILMWKGNKFGQMSRIIISVIGLSLLYPFLQRMKEQISFQKV